MPVSDILTRVRTAAGKKRLFLLHALRQMSRPDRMITTKRPHLSLLKYKGLLGTAYAGGLGGSGFPPRGSQGENAIDVERFHPP